MQCRLCLLVLFEFVRLSHSLINAVLLCVLLLSWATCIYLSKSVLKLKPNTHRRRRRDETVLSRRVGVGGVYINSRRLPTDSAMRTHNTAVGLDPVYNSAANGIEVRYDVTHDAAWFVSTGNCKLGHDCRRVCTHRRRDETRQFRLVGVCGVYWALCNSAGFKITIALYVNK